MKKYFLSLFFLIVNILAAQQEEFYVLHVDGKITYGKDSTLLKPGGIIKGNPTFNFSSSLDKAKLLGTENGYWYLYPKKQEGNSTALFKFSFLKNIQPEKDFLATRGDENSLSYLFFKDNKLINAKKIQVFFKPKDAISYYFFEFKHKDSILRRKLPLSEIKKLVINNDVLGFEKEHIQLNNLFYGNIGFFNSEVNTHKMLRGVTYSFVTIDTVTKQLQYLKRAFKQQGDTPAIILQKLEAYLKDTYGDSITLDKFELHEG